MVHHDKSSNHQFPKKLLIMLLIIFLMLYITFLWLITTGGLDLLVSFYLFHSSLSPLGNSSLSSIPLSLFSFLFFFSPFIYLFLLYNIVLVLPYINMNQCHSPKSSHPLPLPQSPKDYSIHQCLFFCLFCCLIYRVIVTIFLNFIYMHLFGVFLSGLLHSV